MILTYDQADRVSADGLIHDAERLKELQALPLERKIGITAARIIEWYHHWNGNVYISFSGGKDSTVLLHLVRALFPDVPAVFSNTGLEYPELQKFVKSFDNVVTLYPKMPFPQVISTYGYPLISKEVAEAMYYARRIVPAGGDNPQETKGIAWPPKGYRETIFKQMEFLGKRGGGQGKAEGQWHNWRRACFCNAKEQLGEKSIFNKEKWLPIARDLPVMISHYCCNIMKKRVMDQYKKSTGRKPIIGTMTEESRMRKQAWIRHGCNAFDGSKASSQPMSFWTEQDVLAYIKLAELDIASVYGDINIVDKDGNIIQTEEAGMPEGCKWKCSGCQRTGCVYCGFGAHLERGTTRFQRLAITHPRQYEYCISGGQWVDNPAYDPTASMKPDEMGWTNWNPRKIWVPSKKGLGMGKVFDMCNEIIPGLYRYD